MPDKKSPTELWAEALESGEFKQGKNSLVAERHDGTIGYCCLGVACVVYNREMKRQKKRQLDPQVLEPGDWDILDDSTELTRVRDWLGLCDGGGLFNEELPAKEGSLAGLNDSGKRFTTIAKVIRSRPKGLFKK